MYYDEVLFGNAAVGGRTGDFIAWKIAGIPILLMNYIGALKAWIYYPIFSIFPVNYWSIRFPAICFGIAGGIALVASLWRGFGKNTAIVGGIMILLDPTLLTHSRLDWGPNALMFFFRGIIMFSIVSFIKTEKIKWAWIALIASFLGIFDKLNFIWFVCGIAPAFVIVYYYQLKDTIAGPKRKQLLLILGLGLILIFATIIRGLTISQQPVIISWANRIRYAFGLLRYTLSGGGALNFIAGNGLRLEFWIWPGYFVAFFAALFGIKYLFEQKDKQRLFVFMNLTLLLVTCAFVVTKSATGPHHSSMVSGLWQFALAPIVGFALDNYNFKKGQKSILGYVVRIGVAMIFIGSFIANVICINAFAEPTNINWDTANATAALFAKQHPDADFISTDWGIGNQVILLTKDHPGAADNWPSFTTQEGATNIIKDINPNKDTYIYTRLPGFENFKGNHNNVLTALHESNINYQIVQTYNDVHRQPIIQILYIPSVKNKCLDDLDN